MMLGFEKPFNVIDLVRKYGKIDYEPYDTTWDVNVRYMGLPCSGERHLFVECSLSHLEIRRDDMLVVFFYNGNKNITRVTMASLKKSRAIPVIFSVPGSSMVFDMVHAYQPMVSNLEIVVGDKENGSFFSLMFSKSIYEPRESDGFPEIEGVISINGGDVFLNSKELTGLEFIISDLSMIGKEMRSTMEIVKYGRLDAEMIEKRRDEEKENSFLYDKIERDFREEFEDPGSYYDAWFRDEK